MGRNQNLIKNFMGWGGAVERKQKFLPRPLDPPMAKIDESGLLITSPNLIKELYLKTYKHRLRSRQIKDLRSKPKG